MAGCQQQMAVQPSVKTFRPTPFFEHGAYPPAPVDGTIARGHFDLDVHLQEGVYDVSRRRARLVAMIGQVNPAVWGFVGGPNLVAAEFASVAGDHVTEFPMPVTAATLERGRVLYGIFCSVCHDAAGTGHGMIVQRGFTQPPSLHSPRLRSAPAGYLFEVITKGKGAMASYASQIEARERWPIVAWIRVLQRSQNARLEDVPAEVRADLEAAR